MILLRESLRSLPFFYSKIKKIIIIFIAIGSILLLRLYKITKKYIFFNFSLKKFVYVKKKQYLCTVIKKQQ